MSRWCFIAPEIVPNLQWDRKHQYHIQNYHHLLAGSNYKLYIIVGWVARSKVVCFYFHLKMESRPIENLTRFLLDCLLREMIKTELFGSHFN